MQLLSELNSLNRVACLVSGGLDSMVLLEMLFRLKRKVGFDLTGVHFNFHLRSAESDRDENFVNREMERRGVPLIVVQAPLSRGSGVQERARDLRRRHIEKLAAQYGWSHVVLAHHLDDQVETVLMRLMRGAGIKGLRGMERENLLSGGAKLIRPLLSMSREEIQKWGDKQGIAFVTDSSNNRDDYLRNKIRHHLVPGLKKAFPDFLNRIHDACAVLSEANHVIEKRVAALLKASGGYFSTSAYFEEPQEIRFRILRSVLEEGGYQKQFESKHFVELESILIRNKSFRREYGPAIFSHKKGVFTCKLTIDNLL